MRQRTLFKIVLWLLVLALPCLLVPLSSELSRRVTQESLAMLEQNIRRATVQCYALEGFYPPSLSYLERYGVLVDQSRYFVDYRYVAANLLPSVTVLAVTQ